MPKGRFDDKGAVAIGGNGTADKLIFLPEGDTNRFAPEVYWWYRDSGDIEKIAESFEEVKGYCHTSESTHPTIPSTSHIPNLNPVSRNLRNETSSVS